jgi:hypothetical protein
MVNLLRLMPVLVSQIPMPIIRQTRLEELAVKEVMVVMAMQLRTTAEMGETVETAAMRLPIARHRDRICQRLQPIHPLSVAMVETLASVA